MGPNLGPHGGLQSNILEILLSEVDGFHYERGSGSWYSCSFILNGIMTIVGGDANNGEYIQRQISVVESCQLRLIGQLPMNFEHGACNSFYNNEENAEALLCISTYNNYWRPACYRYQGCRAYERKPLKTDADGF